MRPLLLSAITLLALAPAGAQAPMHYKFEMKGTTTVDASALGQPAMDIPITTFALLTVTMTDTAGGRLAHVVIDSVAFDMGPMMAQVTAALPDSMMASAKGAFFHLYVVNGKVQGKALPSATNMSSAMAVGAIALLFPGVRSNVAAGDHWTDTTVADTVLPGGMGTGKTTIIDTWTVTSKDNSSTVLDATETGGLTAGDPGSAMQMAMQMTGTKHVNLAAGGVAHDATGTSTSNGTMTMSVGVMTMKSTSTLSLTALP